MSNLNLIIITFNFLIIFHQTSSIKHVPQYVHHECPKGGFTYSSGSIFESNLTTTLRNTLPANVSLAAVSKITTGEVNALSFCRGDVSGGECRDCVVAAARNVMQKCRFMKEGIIWYEECTLRYGNKSNMFSVIDLEVTPNYLHHNFSGTFRYLGQHERVFNSLMDRLIQEAAYEGNGTGFARGESNLSNSNWLLSGLVQCRPDFGGSQCENCLRNALRQKDGWNTPLVFLPSCNLQFDLYPRASITSSSPGGAKVPLKIIVPVVVVVCAVVLSLITMFLIIRRRRHRQQDREPLPSQHKQDQPRKYSWAKLVWATGCFSRGRILGSGGFGHVYQGTFCDGTDVAVKRLNVSGSLQGNTEFLNEVVSISNLSHPNVVSLKGYSIFLSERLLVYEYVPNHTLEHHLHGNGGQVLSWGKRLRTALNLAEVFAFLHERNPAIIHRDIKPSNILLDGDFQPKVGDFGIAKIFPQNQTHIITIVRGTMGYLDPYYVINEHLTMKSDVFAFGVVLLELISGRKAIIQSGNHITDWANPLIKEGLSEGKIDGVVDENLGNNYDHDEMICMITCAAACVRQWPQERPTMRQVAEVLKGSDERGLELKMRLMRLWENEPTQIGTSMYAEWPEGSLNTSPRSRTTSTTAQIDEDGCFDSIISPTTDSNNQELFYTASPRHHYST